MTSTRRGTETINFALEPEAAETFGPRAIHFQIDPVRLLCRFNGELIDQFARGGAFLDLDEDLGLVPRLDLDGAVESFQMQFRRAIQRESLLLADDLAL